MARIALPQSKLKAKRRRRYARAALAWTILLTILLIVSIAVSWIPQLRLSNVVVEGTTTVSDTVVADSVKNIIGGTYGFMFPRNNVLLYPKDDIADALMSQFSPFRGVSVSLENFSTLRVKVTEREAVALWCGEAIASGTPCTLLDENGVAFAPAPEYSENVFVKFYGALATTTPPQYLTDEQVHTLAAIIHEIQLQLGESLFKTVWVEQNGDVHAYTRTDTDIRFSLNEDSAQVVRNLSLALQSDALRNAGINALSYLDLRFGDRLYYMLKESAAVSTSTPPIR